MVDMRPLASRRLLGLSAVGVLALALTACSSEAEPASSPEPSQTTSQSTTAGPSTSPTASAEDALVAIYEDFACPHCKSFHEQSGAFFADLAQQHPEDLEVDYRIVDFLGGGDPESWSTRAAQAYYCVREDAAGDGTADPATAMATTSTFQGELFAAAPEGLSDEELVSTAAELDLDIADCVAQDAHTDQIDAALAGLSADGLRGVPGIVVNGEAYDPEAYGQLHDWVLNSTGLPQR